MFVIALALHTADANSMIPSLHLKRQAWAIYNKLILKTIPSMATSTPDTPPKLLTIYRLPGRYALI